MEYRAREEGRIIETAFLQISSKGLRSKDVLFTSDVSNKAGVSPIAVKEAASQLDLDVLYRRHDWRQRDIQTRRNAAKKYELLVREAIPIEFITFPK